MRTATPEMKEHRYFTTGQVAKVCKVAPRTVSKWVDSGRLRGFRIPGSQHRRVLRDYLVQFLKEHGMPLGELADDPDVIRVLFVGAIDARIKQALVDSHPDGFKFFEANNAFEVGISRSADRFDCVVLSETLPIPQARRLIANIRKDDTARGLMTPIVAIFGDDRSNSDFAGSPVQEGFKIPFDAILLAERLRTLTLSPQA